MKWIIKGDDGNWYNQFGQRVRLKTKRKINKQIKFQEFEIQAIAYANLVRHFKGYKRIKGEYGLGNLGDINYSRCDIAILDEQCTKPILIIEVKRNLKGINSSKQQINNYYIFCNKVLTICSIEEAENIVNIIKKLNIK
jgi:hypothetical protein